MWRSSCIKLVRVRADCPRSVVRPRREACLGKILMVPDLIAHLAASRYLPHHIGSPDPTTSSLETRDIDQLSKVLFSV